MRYIQIMHSNGGNKCYFRLSCAQITNFNHSLRSQLIFVFYVNEFAVSDHG
jgi:hypothetical protein